MVHKPTDSIDTTTSPISPHPEAPAMTHLHIIYMHIIYFSDRTPNTNQSSPIIRHFYEVHEAQISQPNWQKSSHFPPSHPSRLKTLAMTHLYPFHFSEFTHVATGNSVSEPGTGNRKGENIADTEKSFTFPHDRLID